MPQSGPGAGIGFSPFEAWPEAVSVYTYTMFTYIVILAGGSGTRLMARFHIRQSEAVHEAVQGRLLLLPPRPGPRPGPASPERGVLIVTGAAHAEAAVRENAEPCPPTIRARFRSHPAGTRRAQHGSRRSVRPGAAVDWDGGRRHLLLMASDHRSNRYRSSAPTRRRPRNWPPTETWSASVSRPDTPRQATATSRRPASLGPGRRAASFREKPDKRDRGRLPGCRQFFLEQRHVRLSVGQHAERTSRLRPEDSRTPSRPCKGLRGDRTTAESGPFERWEGLDEAYERTPSISLDFAVSEKSRSVALVEASFSWDDVGSAGTRWPDCSRKETGRSSRSNPGIASSIPTSPWRSAASRTSPWSSVTVRPWSCAGLIPARQGRGRAPFEKAGRSDLL